MSAPSRRPEIRRRRTRNEKIAKLRKRHAAASTEAERTRIAGKLQRMAVNSPGQPLLKKDESLRRVIENAEHLDRDESHEAYVVLNTTADNGTTQVRVFRQLIPNDDQLQVRIFAFFVQFSLQGGEGFDDSH